MRPMKWQNNKFSLLDQRLLPEQEIWIDYDNDIDVSLAIRDMVVRGAPAIGASAAYGLALFALKYHSAAGAFSDDWNKATSNMATARPTAVNLFWAIAEMDKVVSNYYLDNAPNNILSEMQLVKLKDELVAKAEEIAADDIKINKEMGRLGNELLPDVVNIYTHCNAGALATVDYGTALGVVRAAVASGKDVHVYAGETRPYLQGARLTSYELYKDNIPVTLVTDNMAGYLMKLGKVDCVITGADRVAANGDVANKIGTYALSVLAKEHNIPFYVAAPFSTIDSSTVDGDHIEIEQRSKEEVIIIKDHYIAPPEIDVWHPAFDVTPAKNITAIITEKSVYKYPYNFGDLLLNKDDK